MKKDYLVKLLDQNLYEDGGRKVTGMEGFEMDHHNGWAAEEFSPKTGMEQANSLLKVRNIF